MKTDNELIAEFMGHRRGQFIYKHSWDWIMPVVEKIGDMHRIDFGTAHEVTKLHAMSLFAGKEKVYAAVVEYIKWHNKTRKK
jgi:hypothetical protein